MSSASPGRWRLIPRLFLWAAILLVMALANTAIEVMDVQRRGGALAPWEPLIWEISSVTVILMTLPLVWWGCRRWPLHEDTWKRRLPVYVLASVGWSLVHVLGMMALRKLAYLGVGASYVDGAGWASRLFYEYLKDVRVFFSFVALEHLMSWLVRRRQGEAHLFAAPEDAPPEAPVDRPQHFLVRKLGKEFLVATDDVEYAQASGNYVNLRVRGQDYPLRTTMAALSTRLDPALFMRCHRSWLVNRRHLRSIEPADGGDAVLHMADGARVPCSRRQLHALRQVLGAG